MKSKEYIKLLIPPIFKKLYIKYQERYNTKDQKTIVNINLTGPYFSWNEAKQVSIGYDADLILEKTKTALLKVKSGEAVYERDSVLYNEIHYSWPVLAGLMKVAAQSEGRLNVLDFGGSLGSTYYQNRVFLETLPSVRWNVVEQLKHVKVGKKLFEDKNIRFYTSINDCIEKNSVNVILLSGVLQYLERPYGIFLNLLDLPCDYIIIDRTPFYSGLEDLIFLQTVPPNIYSASYPCWVFSKNTFLSMLIKNKKVVLSEFKSLDNLQNPVHAEWKGMFIVSNKLIDITS